MFTGIVEGTGEVLSVTEAADGHRLRIAADPIGGDLDRGASVAVSGVCLTVEDAADPADGRPWFEVFLAAETLDRSYLGALSPGDHVNLERALPVDGRLDGHVVQGHVDTTTEVVDVRRVGEDWTFEFAVPEGYGKYVAEKGSIALDGISLTVAGRDPESFTVAIIPTTYELTSLGDKEVGDPVHVEIDVLARYAERLLAEEDPESVPVRGVGDGGGDGAGDE